MYGIGYTELLIVVALSALALFPLWRIMRRLGYSSVVSLLWAVGMLYLALPTSFLLAYSRWPIEDGESSTRAT